jgi:hypothetical protein
MRFRATMEPAMAETATYRMPGTTFSSEDLGGARELMVEVMLCS